MSETDGCADGRDDHGGSDGRGRGEGNDHDGHGHAHGGSDASTRKLAVVASINLVGFVAEFAGGLLFGSVALLSDAVHMLFDALAYVMAFAASALAERYEVSDRWSYGLHRLEPLSAFLNGVLLFPMVGFILYESYHRFLDPVAVGTGPTLALASAGLVVNVASVFVLEGDDLSLNEKGAFYHLVGDAGASVAVIVSTVVVDVTGVAVVDPVTAVLIAGIVVWSALKLLKGSGEIFLHTSAVSGPDARECLRDLDGVDRVVDFHSWQICSEITVVTTHIHASVDSADEAETVTHEIHDELDALGADHATVELCLGDNCRGVHLDAHSH